MITFKNIVITGEKNRIETYKMTFLHKLFEEAKYLFDLCELLYFPADGAPTRRTQPGE